MVPKRKILTLKEKGELIKEVEKNPHLSKVKLAEKFQLPTSTLATILMHKETILKTIAKCGSASSKRKNSRASPYQYLEDKLLDWLIHRQENKLPINSCIIREQAKIMAVDLGLEKFTASSGWIDRFKNRHGLGNRAVFCESVAECKNRWASIRDSFPEATEPKKKQRGGEVTYTQSIYDDDYLLGVDSTEKSSSHLMQLENPAWPASYANFPDQGGSKEGQAINFPEIKVEVDEEDKLENNNPATEGGNCDYQYIVPTPVCEVTTDMTPSGSKIRTSTELDEGTAKSKICPEQCSSVSELVASTETDYKPPEHPIETFFKSMAATVLTFPPHLMAIAKLNVCKLITELELRALTEKNPFDGSEDKINELLSENVIGTCSSNSVSAENDTTNRNNSYKQER